MTQRVAGFTPETARQLLGIVRDGRSYGKQSVVYPEPSRGIGTATQRKKIIDFSLAAELTTDNASVAGTIVAEYGPGTAAPSSSVTLINPMDKAFFGESGARGLALWHEDSEYVIIQLGQDCTPPAEEE
jgi:hypothetical protein